MSRRILCVTGLILVTGTASAGGSNWNVISPSGSVAPGADDAAITTAWANSAAQPVWMTPGIYQVCQQHTIPDNGIIAAPSNQAYNIGSYAGLVQSPPVMLYCSTNYANSGFSSGQAFIRVSSNSANLDGVGVWGFSSGTAPVNCVDIRQSSFFTWHHPWAFFCQEGVLANGQGGPTQGFQMIGPGVIGRNFGRNFDAAQNGVTDGSTLRDALITGVNFEGNSAGDSNVSLWYPGAIQFNNNRIEDGAGYGLDCENCDSDTFVGNLFDRAKGPSVRMYGGEWNTFVGNRIVFSFWNAALSPSNPAYHVSFGGSISGLTMYGNSFDNTNGDQGETVNSIYKADNGFTFFVNGGRIDNGTTVGDGGNGVLNARYVDAYTMSVVAPLMPAKEIVQKQVAVLGATTALTFSPLPTYYPSLEFSCYNLLVSSTGNTLAPQLGEGTTGDGGSSNTWQTSYNTAYNYGRTNGTGGGQGSVKSADLFDGQFQLSASLPAGIDHLTMSNFASSTPAKLTSWQAGGWNQRQKVFQAIQGLSYYSGDTNPITGVRFLTVTGTWGGTCTMYGRNS